MRGVVRIGLWCAITAFSAPGLCAESDGAALFKQHCAACHQADGSGVPGLAPPLKGAHWKKLLKERSYLPRVAAFGLTGAIRVGDATFNSAMPAQPQIGDEQLAVVINFVAVGLNAEHLPSDWPAYVASDVAAVRAAPHSGTEQRQLRKEVLAR